MDNNTISHQQNLQRKSRRICFVITIFIYPLYLGWAMGDWYMWQGFLPIMSVLYAVPSVLLFLPACRFVARFLDRSNTKAKRYTSLLLIAVPLTGLTAFFLYQIVDFHYISAPSTFVKQQQKLYDDYRTAFEDNVELLNTVNDEILGSKTLEGTIYSIHCQPDSEIQIVYWDEENERVGQSHLLGELPLSVDEKATITALMEAMSQLQGSKVVYYKDNFMFILGYSVRNVRFVKDSSIRYGLPVAGTEEQLDFDWTIGIYAWDEKGA